MMSIVQDMSREIYYIDISAGRVFPGKRILSLRASLRLAGKYCDIRLRRDAGMQWVLPATNPARRS
jgi:hypothetical protein